MKELAIKELMRSKEEKRILTGKINGIEDEYYKLKGESISCALVWYEDIKILIPITHLGFDGVINKSTIDEINGKWNLKYDLSKITYERENEIYKIKNYNDYNFNFPEEIVVSNTETRFKFSYELNNISKGDSISINKESYIKTKNDVIFTSNKNYEYIEHIVQCELTFELSTFNSTSTMQLIIPTESGNDIILELVKKEQEK